MGFVKASLIAEYYRRSENLSKENQSMLKTISKERECNFCHQKNHLKSNSRKYRQRKKNNPEKEFKTKQIRSRKMGANFVSLFRHCSLHADVWGSMQTVSLSGMRYMLTFIDDFTKYTVVHLLKLKSEVFKKLKEYVCVVHNKFQRKPVILRSDRGGYTGTAVKKFLRDNGIQMQYTAPYVKCEFIPVQIIQIQTMNHQKLM